ncbi:MAG: hypothetical protein U1E67_07975 [Hyphomicrobiales bacterium]
MVSQIERCCRYAERTDRTVIVDTKFGAGGYGDEFDRYFISRQRRLILSARDLHPAFDRASTFPTFLQGRVSSYDVGFNENTRAFVEKVTLEPLTFDFGRDYPHELLVHQQQRRLPIAVSVFMRLRLQPLLTRELLSRFAKIGAPYLGIHVRHTDYHSDYRPLIERVAASNVAKVFLATDNRQVLDEFRASLPGKQIFSFTEDLSVDGKPIHLHSPADGNVFKRNCDAILDLLLLALSDGVDSAEITNSPFGIKKSGFMVLATELANQRRYLSELLGDTVRIGLD